MKTNKIKLRSNGFSLIELIVVIAIIGLLAAIAIPSYKGHMLKSQRVDGVAFLIEVASDQVRFYSEYNRYGTTMAELGYGEDATAVSNEGHYVVSIVTPAGAATYTLTATPVPGGPQIADADCLAMTINSSGVKTITGSTTPANCW